MPDDARSANDSPSGKVREAIARYHAAGNAYIGSVPYELDDHECWPDPEWLLIATNFTPLSNKLRTLFAEAVGLLQEEVAGHNHNGILTERQQALLSATAMFATLPAAAQPLRPELVLGAAVIEQVKNCDVDTHVGPGQTLGAFALIRQRGPDPAVFSVKPIIQIVVDVPGLGAVSSLQFLYDLARLAEAGPPPRLKR